MQNLGPSGYFDSYHNHGHHAPQQLAHPISTGFTQSEYSDGAGAYGLPSGMVRVNQYQPRPLVGKRNSSPGDHKNYIQSSTVDVKPPNHRAAVQHQAVG